MTVKRVKNTIIKPFDTIFLIVFGFILTEHTKNLVQLYVNNKPPGILLLGFALFLLLFLSIAETVLDYSNSDKTINSDKVIPGLLRHLVWFLQFFPVFYIVSMLVTEGISEEKKVQQISVSLTVIYTLYIIINLIKMLDSSQDQRKGIWLNVGFYFLITLLFWLNYRFLASWFSSPAQWLALLLVVVLVAYILYWKRYYHDIFFKPDEEGPAPAPAAN